MIKYLFVFIIGGVFLASNWASKIKIDGTSSIADIEEQLGFDNSSKKPKMDLPGVSVENGRKIVHEGISNKANGRKTRKQSKHFVCTSCHNTAIEDPDLTSYDPEARLDFVRKKGMPFLQGTTFYGAVNRTTYYNGDYYKKYGDLVEEARNDIRASIQLCAVECAQGRSLKDWEIESVLAYFWSLELKLTDINLTEEELKEISSSSSENDKKKSLELIQSKYLQSAPVTFVPPPADRKRGSGLVGNAENGFKIYESSCLHCHYQGKYSYLSLDTTPLSLKHMAKHIDRYSSHSMYQVIRWGVPSKGGRHSYMPQYPLEKMSEQQLADLRAYFESKS